MTKSPEPSILDDPFWQEDGRKFCAELDRQMRAALQPLGRAGWRARRVFRAVAESRQEWLDARSKKTLPPGS